MNILKKISAVLLFVLLLISPVNAQAEIPEELTGQDVKTMTVQEVARYYGIDPEEYVTELKARTGIAAIAPDSQFQLLHDNFGMEPSLARDIAEAIGAQNQGDDSLMNVLEEAEEDAKPEKQYNFPVIAGILIFLYGLSYWLVKAKILDLALQRRIWNITMGTFFFATALLGIFLVLRISHGMIIPLPFNMLFWHVETGIAFSVIAIFHALWHWPYFKAIFKVRNRKSDGL
jgi:hypothetical protein